MRALLLSLFLLSTPSLAGELRVAVAANFKLPIERLINSHPFAGELKLSSAASGTLYTQIINGAPFDVFLSADATLPAKLAENGKGIAETRQTYAHGQLSLVSHSRTAQTENTNIAALLSQPDVSLAIAKPRLAPYGKAAMEVLQKFAAKPQIVQGNNINQAYQLWFSGGADMAIVARSQAGGIGIDIPKSWHSPLPQQAIVLSDSESPTLAGEFLDWLSSDDVQASIVRLGYGRGSAIP